MTLLLQKISRRIVKTFHDKNCSESVQTCVSLIAVPSELLSPNLENKTNLDLRSAVSESKGMKIWKYCLVYLYGDCKNMSQREKDCFNFTLNVKWIHDKKQCT